MMNRFTRGPRELRDNLNRDKERIDGVSGINLRGSEFISVNRMGGLGVAIGLNLMQLLKRIPKRGGDGGGEAGELQYCMVGGFHSFNEYDRIKFSVFRAGQSSWFNSTTGLITVPTAGVYSVIFHTDGDLEYGGDDPICLALYLSGVFESEFYTRIFKAGQVYWFNLTRVVKTLQDNTIELYLWCSGNTVVPRQCELTVIQLEA